VNFLQNISLKFSVMDQDRYCGPVEMGHTFITLKEANQIVEEPEKFSTTQFITEKRKVTLGYIMIAKITNYNYYKITKGIKDLIFTDLW